MRGTSAQLLEISSVSGVISVQSLSCAQLFATPWTGAHQSSLSITNCQSLLKLMPIELVMVSNHLMLSPLLHLLSSIFPGIRVFFNKSVLYTRWPKYWSFSFNISPSIEYSGLILKSLLQYHINSFALSLFFFCLQSFPASGSFPMSHLFTLGGQSIGASASASVLLKSICG